MHAVAESVRSRESSAQQVVSMDIERGTCTSGKACPEGVCLFARMVFTEGSRCLSARDVQRMDHRKTF